MKNINTLAVPTLLSVPFSVMVFGGLPAHVKSPKSPMTATTLLYVYGTVVVMVTLPGA